MTTVYMMTLEYNTIKINNKIMQFTICTIYKTSGHDLHANLCLYKLLEYQE